MAYDEALAARIRALTAGEPVVEKKMFGGLAFLLGGHMAVAASGQGGLLVRVEPSQTEALLHEPGAAPKEMGGRGAMAGWLRVAAEAVDDDETLATWVQRGLDHAGSLPPK
jgi:TfoX/Sxy family transcriptional regulator of competence genes